MMRSIINYEVSCDVLNVSGNNGSGMQIPINRRICISGSNDVVNLFIDMAKKVSDMLKTNDEDTNKVYAEYEKGRDALLLQNNALKAEIKKLKLRRRSRKGLKK